MITTRKFLASALLLGALSTSAFGATNDWTSDDWADQDDSRNGSMASVSKSDNSWELSFETFVGLTSDEYYSGNDETSLQIFGEQFLLNKKIDLGTPVVGFDIGLLGIIDFGYNEWGSYEEEITQFDLMLGPQAGVRFQPNKKVSFGFGVQVGLDWRYGEYSYDGWEYYPDGYYSYSYHRDYDYNDSELGTFFGIYGNMRISLSEHWALSMSYHFMQTSVDFGGDFKGVEEDIAYHMFSIGAAFTW